LKTRAQGCLNDNLVGGTTASLSPKETRGNKGQGKEAGGFGGIVPSTSGRRGPRLNEAGRKLQGKRIFAEEQRALIRGQ